MTRWMALLFLVPALLLTGCFDGADMAGMEVRGGKYYQKKAKWPYSGKAVTYFPGKRGEERKIFMQGQLKGGLKEGKWIHNKWNGEYEKAPYRRGKKHGEVIVYYKSGKKKSTQEYVNGRPDGVGTFFNSSGDPVRHVYYKEGSRAPLPKDAEGDILKKVEMLFDIFSSGFKGNGG